MADAEEKTGERRVRCDALGEIVTLPKTPRRVAVLASGLTEAIWEMGLAERVAAVSQYCQRYVNTGARPVAGDYLRIDEDALRRVNADLVLMTNGVQLGVARRLRAAGFPVFVLPVPDSVFGILENIRRLGALLNAMPPALALTEKMAEEIAALLAVTPGRRPLVYTELWFGRHPRRTGGLSFARDIVRLAGGEFWGEEIAGGYLPLDLAAVEKAGPEVVLVFWEEDDFPVDVRALLAARGWEGKWPFRVIEASIARGKNLIHDGPSILETARWLGGEFLRKG